jgi:hypothetical protein
MEKGANPTGTTSEQHDDSGCLSGTVPKEESSPDSARLTRRADFPSAQELAKTFAAALNRSVMEEAQEDERRKRDEPK